MPLGYTRAEIVGQHHSLFVEPEEQNLQAYSDHWNRLRAGEFIEGRFKRVGKNGNVIWMQGNYIPIIGPSGKPLKIVKYASEVTERVEARISLQHLLDEATGVMEAMAQGDLTRKVMSS